MKKITDEELDRQLFTALSTPPREGLSYDFSAKLRQNLKHKLQQKNRLRFYMGWAMVFLMVMVALFFCLKLIDNAYQTNVTEVIAQRKWIFIISFVVVFLIQYLDHTSIRSGQFKKNSDTKNSI